MKVPRESQDLKVSSEQIPLLEINISLALNELATFENEPPSRLGAKDYATAKQLITRCVRDVRKFGRLSSERVGEYQDRLNRLRAVFSQYEKGLSYQLQIIHLEASRCSGRISSAQARAVGMLTGKYRG